MVVPAHPAPLRKEKSVVGSLPQCGIENPYPNPAASMRPSHHVMET